MTENTDIWVSGARDSDRAMVSVALYQPNGRGSFLGPLYQHEDVTPMLHEVFLKWMYYDLTEKQKANLPDFFFGASRLPVISERYYDLLRDFDLGPTRFYEVPLYEYDQKTKRRDRLYLLQLNASKEALVPEECEGFRPAPGGGLESIPSNFTGGIRALLPAARKGVDLWFDPGLDSRWFYSERLYSAIKKERIRCKHWAFQKCKITD
ncbi:MAG: hypothetical protein HKO95_17160 [Rhodobacteraceae bacterium]|nr:hypothetical protein [Paracoccaceae bacterium]